MPVEEKGSIKCINYMIFDNHWLKYVNSLGALYAYRFFPHLTPVILVQFKLLEKPIDECQQRLEYRPVNQSANYINQAHTILMLSIIRPGFGYVFPFQYE